MGIRRRSTVTETDSIFLSRKKNPGGREIRIGGIAVLLVFAALIGACHIKVGREFDSSKVKQIQIDRSTKADVVALFGDPVKTGLDSGFESWTYLYEHVEKTSQLSSKELYLTFHPDGRVKSYNFSTNFPGEMTLYKPEGGK